TARSGLEQRVAEHNAGTYGGYMAQRRPVTLVFSQWFERITDAIAAERQGKGWSRAKKEALIRGDFGSLHQLSKGRRTHPPTGRGKHHDTRAAPRTMFLRLHGRVRHLDTRVCDALSSASC